MTETEAPSTLRMLCTSPPTKRKRDSLGVTTSVSDDVNCIVQDVSQAIGKFDRVIQQPIESQCYIGHVGDSDMFYLIFEGENGEPPFIFSSGASIIEATRRLEQLMSYSTDTPRMSQIKTQYCHECIKQRLIVFMMVFHDALAKDDDQLIDIDTLLDELDTI